MKLKEILNTKRFQKQNNVGKVGSLDFWNSRHQQFFLVLTTGVQTVAQSEADNRVML
jgi:hypothetical protein